MKTAEEYLRDLWNECFNYDLQHPNRGHLPTINVLRKSEWSEEFERAMRYRLIMGAFRYGQLGGKDKPSYDRLNCMKRRIEQYQKDGNQEHLVDIANLALCEFVEGDHPKKHFKSIDDGNHTEKVKR